MMRKSERGATVMLASRPYMAARLKCCMANGAVAAPATRLAMAAAATHRPAPWTAEMNAGV